MQSNAGTGVLGKKTLQTGLINKHNLFSFKHYRVKIKFHYYYYYLLCGTILLVQGSFELDDKSQDKKKKKKNRTNDKGP